MTADKNIKNYFKNLEKELGPDQYANLLIDFWKGESQKTLIDRYSIDEIDVDVIDLILNSEFSNVV